MRRFILDRRKDVSGTSGVGIVAEGVQFSDGTCALRWLGSKSSTAVYKTAEELVEIHGHGGLTVLIWEEAAASPEPARQACFQSD